MKTAVYNLHTDKCLGKCSDPLVCYTVSTRKQISTYPMIVAPPLFRIKQSQKVKIFGNTAGWIIFWALIQRQSL